MARAIDGGTLRDNLTDIYGDGNRLVYLNDVLDLIDEQPTLTPPNEPLTLKELREMDGVNALWVHNLAFGLHKPRFMLVKNVSEDWWTCCDFDGFKTFCAADYGERYLLYRRPPEVSP